MKSIELPKIGLGTYQMKSAVCKEAVLKGIEIGYRFIDTAQIYGNESAVGDAINESTVNQKELIIATKVWLNNYCKKVYSSAILSREKLKIDSIDILYLHWPGIMYKLGNPKKIFAELNRLQEDGVVKHIAVSNFNIALIKEAMQLSKTPIVANQIETHPMLRQPKMYAFLKDNDIQYVAYSPIARGNLGDIPELKKIAGDKSISVTQLALAWEIAKGIIPIPKASSYGHLKENFEAQSIALTKDQIETIDNLPVKKRMFNPPFLRPKWDD